MSKTVPVHIVKDKSLLRKLSLINGPHSHVYLVANGCAKSPSERTLLGQPSEALQDQMWEASGTYFDPGIWIQSSVEISESPCLSTWPFGKV